jgi:hypothetical protein
MLSVAVRVAIDLTPIVGLDVFIEGESSTSATPPAQTDEAGVATQLVKRSDTVTISSALGAVQFDPVTGAASALHELGLVDIEAWRLVEPAHMCRYLDASNQEALALYMNNISSQELEVPRRQTLNSLHAGDSSLTETQPHENFTPGLSFFTVLLDEFRTSGSQSCASGTWKLLGVEKNISCADGAIHPDVPLCEARAELPCVPVSESRVTSVRHRVRHAVQAVKKLEREVKRRYPEENRSYSVTRDLVKATNRMNRLLQDVQSVASSCTQVNPRCYEVRFPREELIKAFKRSFGPRPPKGRIYFRAVRNYNLTRFRKLLKGFPDFLVKCD